MLKPVSVLAVLAVVFGAYAVWPLLSAFEIKQAIHAGDVAKLQRMVYWAPVRASLKASIAALPPASLSLNPSAAVSATGERQISIWGRVKAAVAPIVADRAIDTYLTAEGISELQRARRGGFLSILGLPQSKNAAEDDADPQQRSGVLQRFVRFYSKIIHARFQSLSEVEIEIADHAGAAHHIISSFELSGFEWKLASVRVVAAPAPSTNP